MSGMKKRLFLILVIFLLVQVIMLRFPTAASASSEVVYEPITTEYGIFNRYNYKSLGFYRYYTGFMNFFNTIEEFGLKPYTKYDQLVGEFTWRDFAYTTDEKTGQKVKTIYGYLATSEQQLQVNLSATLHNHKHKHGNWWDGEYTTVGYQLAFIQADNHYFSIYANGSDFASKGTATQTLGYSRDNKENPVSYQLLNPKSEYFTDFLKFFSAVTSTEYPCKDGKVYIEDIVVAFADIKDPVVKKVYTCDENGNSKYLFNSGEPIYLKVECDEPIRFSDNKSNHGDIQIKMTGTGDANAEITGHLIALKENYLMFKFEDTSVFNSKEVVMTAVDLTPLYGDRYWDLRDILGKKAADMGIQLVPAFQSTDKITEYGYDKSICLITDVAGNPLRELGRERQVYELNQNCYIDGISPFVEKIDVVTQMNNAKVKKALGKEKLPPSDPGYPDESDHSAAPGDNITFTATFNENFLLDGKDYPRGYYSYIQAVLNVKDEKGNPVKLDAYEVYTIVPRDYYYNPAYKDKKATIRFDTFTVKEGMTYINPEDTKIRIERIEIGNGHTLTDMNGNVYDGSVDINKNTADIKLDMTGPQITTDATPSGEGYAPKPVAFDQKNNIVQFYFPVKISDESGVNLLDGSFSWINGLPVNTDAPGETMFSFDFAVTASEQPPEDPEAWTTGAMGQLYTFTQVESGNYIHIRLLDNEQYNIGSSIIKIIAEDYAGKKGEASFNLDYSMDKGEPSASLVKTGKRYDHTQNEGALTAQVLATDNNSGLKEIYYLWVDSNGDEPNADYPGWIAAGAFTEGTKSYIFNADKEKIQGESYSGKLYVKIKDVAGNERIVPLGSYTYNIAAPKYTLEYSKIRQTEATLHISDIPTGNAVVVMIKNPGPDNIYFVSVIDDDTYGGGDILNNSSFDAGFLNDVYSWQVYRVTAKSAYQYEFEYVGSPDFLNYGLTLQSIIEGNYY